MKKIQSKVDLKETVLILLDYFAENETNLVKLSESSKKLIVIDHHQSFFDILKTNQTESLLLSKQVTLYGNITNSAAILTYTFCESLFGDILRS